MQGRYEKIIYENDRGQKVEIAYSFPYFLQSINGTDGTNANITKIKGVGQDGTTITDVNLSDRAIQIVGGIKGSSKEEIAKYRAELLKIFNPKVQGWLQYEYGDIKRRIRCQVENAPVFSKKNKSYKQQEFLVNLICPNPFWLDTFIESEEMADWVGGLRFPLQLPMMFAGRSTRQSTIIYNSGDVETPVIIEFIGPATNPKIIKTNTGEYIQVNREIGEDEKLIVSTGFGDKRVILKNRITGEETNAFGWIDLGSTFFQLDVGNNLISYSAESGQETAKVWIKWRNRYLGV